MATGALDIGGVAVDRNRAEEMQNRIEFLGACGLERHSVLSA